MASPLLVLGLVPLLGLDHTSTSKVLENSINKCTSDAQSNACYHINAQHMFAISIIITVNCISISGEASLS